MTYSQYTENVTNLRGHSFLHDQILRPHINNLSCVRGQHLLAKCGPVLVSTIKNNKKKKSHSELWSQGIPYKEHFHKAPRNNAPQNDLMQTPHPVVPLE